MQEDIGKIVGSRNKIKFLRFLAKNSDWQFNLAFIANQIKTDKSAISRLVKEFEKSKIIEVNRQGRLLMFKLNRSNKFISQIIIPMFEQEKKLK
jgi:DNA-binding MarR family transcriptional regulator